MLNALAVLPVLAMLSTAIALHESLKEHDECCADLPSTKQQARESEILALSQACRIPSLTDSFEPPPSYALSYI